MKRRRYTAYLEYREYSPTVPWLYRTVCRKFSFESAAETSAGIARAARLNAGYEAFFKGYETEGLRVCEDTIRRAS